MDNPYYVIHNMDLYYVNYLLIILIFHNSFLLSFFLIIKLL